MDDNETKSIVDGLRMIVEYFGGVPEQGKVKFWEDMARRLSRIVRLDEPWGWRYPKQVYEGQTRPSEMFASAVMALGAALDEVPTVLAYTVQVRVFSRPGAVDDGSVILGASKPCARPGCKVRMVPSVPWRKYCCDECRELANKQNRRSVE